mmetsp:Transcript_8438/g.24010  ORF Transcript_8438/g.24010 Transcript_8438/m.24010 type:complete len:90 (+) Transcript_8438:172-441(+)
MADKGKEASPAQQVSGPADGEPEDTCVDFGDEGRPPASEAAAGMQTCLRFLEPLCPSGSIYQCIARCPAHPSHSARVSSTQVRPGRPPA